MVFKPQSALIRELSLLVAVLAFALAVPSGSAQLKRSTSLSIKNFGKINDTYYRGSQPREVDVEQLKSLGIKTIIDLRRDPEAGEVDWVNRAGMRYFNIPLRSSRAASEEQTAYFMSIVNNPANWPVYVHCKGGRHRTGALTAVYRMTHDGWTADQAFEEMKRYDFNHGLFGGPSDQKKFVFEYYQRHLAGRSQN
jgi:protein tyrosine/serine phosphatase